MGACVHCGKPAGFLRKQHRDCAEKHRRGEELIVNEIVTAAKTSIQAGSLKAALEKISEEHFILQAELIDLVKTGWEKSVNAAFEDGILSEEEESSLVRIKNEFSLNQDDLDESGEFTRLVKGAVLRDLLEGRLPDRLSVDISLPFNFQKSEKLVWLFQDVDYYEEKTKREYVGGSQGVSIRVAKGLYYRAGAFKGKPITTTETVHAGNGMLAVTNKHLYFGGGSGKPFRVRFDKIISFEPFSDGIGIQRDAATAKPQRFSTGDGWFTYNLVQNVSSL